MSKIVIGFIPHFPYDKWSNCKSVTKELTADLTTYSALGSADKCAWGRYKEQITPVFVLPKGRELAKYIRDWTTGEPEKFFKFYALSSKDKYALVLYPQHDRLAIPEGYKIYCSPIVFVTSDMSMFKRVRFTSKTYVGFLDSGELKPKEIHETLTPDFLGPFDVDDPQRLSFYTKTIFS